MADLVKYPRTPHLPWSEGVSNDDRIIESLDSFKGIDIVVTEKMDGENTTLYHDAIHARSLSSSVTHWRKELYRFWNSIKNDIPTGFRVCGENTYATHSIHYSNLKHYFLGFSIWENEVCLGWDETLEWFKMIGVTPVNELYRGPFNENLHSQIWDPSQSSSMEGYIIRDAGSFSLETFGKKVAKYVRKGHVQTDAHWTSKPIIPNELVKCH